MKKNSIYGFTVMEIVVTMVVSSIVVLTSFEFYKIFNKMYLSRNFKMEIAKESFQFFRTLENDLFKSENFNCSDEGLLFQIKQEEDVIYETYEHYVIRVQNLERDTFKVRLMNLRTDKDRVTGFERIVKMDMVTDRDTLSLFFEKNYSNDVMLNAEILKP